jgi:hypothetical protein
MSSFVEEQKDLIHQLNLKVADAIESLKIDTTIELSVAKCLKITGEINKSIKSIVALSDAIKNVSPEDKAGVLLAITLTTINSDEVKSLLSEEQAKSLESFCQDAETVETIVSLVDWVGDEILVSMDINEDGVVDEDEIEVAIVDCCTCGSESCCSCCVSFSKSFASCWSSFCLRFLCCSKKGIRYRQA